VTRCAKSVKNEELACEFARGEVPKREITHIVSIWFEAACGQTYYTARQRRVFYLPRANANSNIVVTRRKYTTSNVQAAADAAIEENLQDAYEGRLS
jgi:hypothetical protein